MDKVENKASEQSRQHTPPDRGTDTDAATSDVPLTVRNNMIAIAAYYKAEHRGFVPGGEMEDWLAAEAEIEQLLTLN